MDDLSTGRRENVPEGARFYEMDVRSGCSELFEDFKPEALSVEIRQNCPQAFPGLVLRYALRSAPDYALWCLTCKLCAIRGSLPCLLASLV